MLKRKPQGFWAELLESIIIGAVIGAVVGLYQLAMQYVVKGAQFMYTSKNPWIITAMVVAVAVLAVFNHFVLKHNPGVRGSGVPHMEHAIRHDHHIEWKKELPLMLANSFASGFVGMPLGTEGPSVVIGGKTAEMVEDVVSAGEEDTVVMGFGVGFGCAMLSPLAGVCYIFEEALKKFNFKFFVRGIAMMVVAFLVTSLFNDHHMLHVQSVVLLPFKNYYVFAFLVVVNLLLGCAFTKGLILAKGILDENSNKLWSKYFGFVLFAVVLVLNFLCRDLMGSGLNIIENISRYTDVWLLFAILALRFVITIFAGTGRVTGGLVVSTFALGALGGQMVCLVCNDLLGMPTDSNPVIILMSMCILFSVVNKNPVTASALFFSAIGYSAGDYISVLPIMPMTVVAIFSATLLSKLFVKDGLYHLLANSNIQKESSHQQKCTAHVSKV